MRSSTTTPLGSSHTRRADRNDSLAPTTDTTSLTPPRPYLTRNARRAHPPVITSSRTPTLTGAPEPARRYQTRAASRAARVPYSVSASQPIPPSIVSGRLTRLPATAIESVVAPAPIEPAVTASGPRRSFRIQDLLHASDIPIRSHLNRGPIMISFNTPTSLAGPSVSSSTTGGLTFPIASTSSTSVFGSGPLAAGNTASSSKSPWPTSPEISRTGPLSCTLKVVHDDGQPGLDMIGSDRTGTGYSLCGNCVLEVPNLPVGGGAPFPGWKDRKREIKSLKIAFEGKSEYWDNEGRYEAVQLCKIEQSLLPNDKPQRLGHAQPSPTSARFKHYTTAYSVGFDIKLPGWLPQSYLSDHSAVVYGLVVKAEIGWAGYPESDLGATASLSSNPEPVWAPISSLPIPIGSGFSSASRFIPRLAKSFAHAFGIADQEQFRSDAVQTTTSSFVEVDIRRHRAMHPSHAYPDVNGAPGVALRNYTLKPSEDSPSPIECVVTTPEVIDLNATFLKASIRLKARKVKSTAVAEPNAGPQPAGIMAPTTADSSSNEDTPMPSSDDEDEDSSSEGSGVFGKLDLPTGVKVTELSLSIEQLERNSSTPMQTYTSVFPLPEQQPSTKALVGSPEGFLSPPSHMCMSILGPPTTIGRPVKTTDVLLGEDGKPRTYRFDGDGFGFTGNAWRKVNIQIPMPTAASSAASGVPRPDPEIDTPHLRVKHKLKVKLVCKTEEDSLETIVVLSVPVKISTAAPTKEARLPAYTQVFYENGAVKEDDQPLPLYEPKQIPDVPSYEMATGGDESLPLPSTPVREAMEMDRSDAWNDPSNLNTPPRLPSLPLPIPIPERLFDGEHTSRRTTFAPPSSSFGIPSTPDLVGSPSSFSESIASVPPPRTPRSASPASTFESARAYTGDGPERVGTYRTGGERMDEDMGAVSGLRNLLFRPKTPEAFSYVAGPPGSTSNPVP